MKRVVAFIGLIGFGLVVGIVSALLMSGVIGKHRPKLATSVIVDNWVSDWALGTKGATSYMRSYVARNGLLALPKSEAVYFVRTMDDDGERLREECHYRVSGGPQQALWWSLTLYDETSFLPPNDDKAYSVDQTKMGNGAWSAYVQPNIPDAQGAAWLSSKRAGTFDVMLRLYKPSKALLKFPKDTLNPPSIKRLECKAKPS